MSSGGVAGERSRAVWVCERDGADLTDSVTDSVGMRGWGARRGTDVHSMRPQGEQWTCAINGDP
eukprot:362980-Chlamydomonas_euryale.AAC.3